MSATKEEIIDIQTRQLAEWKTVLKPEVFKELRKRANRDNGSIEDPYKIFRGSTMDCWVSNAAIRLRAGTKVEELNDGNTHPNY